MALESRVQARGHGVDPRWPKDRGFRPGLRFSVAALASLFLLACAAPRTVTWSPESTPRRHFRIEGDYSAHVPTQTTTALYGGLKNGVAALWNNYARGDTVPITADSLNDLTRALIAYSMDPLIVQPELALHYGLFSGYDIGYRYAGGAHAFDARCQFLGGGLDAAGWKGSLAVQYSFQKFELPGVLYLDKLQEILRYEFKRKDILVPVIFGKGFGARGRFGSFGMGAVYDLAFVEYGTSLMRLVERLPDSTTRRFPDLRGDRTVSAYGGFANIRAGYVRVFAVAGLSVFWQDYGRFALFGGRNTHLRGWTYTPSLGLEVRI